MRRGSRCAPDEGRAEAPAARFARKSSCRRRSKALKAILKHLVEVQAKSIEGLNATITVDYTETPVGGAGEMQEDVSNVTRQRSNPTFTWTEKYGKPINAFLEYWIFQLLGDPESKIPQVVTRGTKKPTDLLPDY